MLQIWLKGPKWLGPSSELQQETKIAPELVAITLENNNSLDKLLGKFNSWKVLRPSTWINRFISTCGKTRFRRLLKANEIEKLKKFRIKRERKRQRFRDTEKVKIDVKSLNLQEDEAVDIYKERIEGVHPTSQKSSGLQKKLFSEHKGTLNFTMSSVRSRCRHKGNKPSQVTKLYFQESFQKTNDNPVYFNHNSVQQVPSQKHLEMYLDTKVNFQEHLNMYV